MTKAERPNHLGSTTQRIDTGWGKLYVTVTEDEDGEPFEVFVNTGMSGGLFNAQAEAIGKTVSVALRMTEDRTETAVQLSDQLMGIRTDKIGHDNGDEVLSVPDGIGIALRRHITGSQGLSVREEEQS
jgi:ribonucleoside-diphosphate reductase alpha chain